MTILYKRGETLSFGFYLRKLIALILLKHVININIYDDKQLSGLTKYLRANETVYKKRDAIKYKTKEIMNKSLYDYKRAKEKAIEDLEMAREYFAEDGRKYVEINTLIGVKVQPIKHLFTTILLDYAYQTGMVNPASGKLNDFNSFTNTVIKNITAYLDKNVNKMEKWLIEFSSIKETTRDIVNSLCKQIFNYANESGFYHTFQALHSQRAMLLYLPKIEKIKLTFKTYTTGKTKFHILKDSEGHAMRDILEQIFYTDIRKNLYNISFEKVLVKKDKQHITKLKIKELMYSDFILNMLKGGIDDYNLKLEKRIIDIHKKLEKLPVNSDNLGILFPKQLRSIEPLPVNIKCNIVLQSIAIWDKTQNNFYQITRDKHEVSRLKQYWGYQLLNINEKEECEVDIEGALIKPTCFVRELGTDHDMQHYDRETLYLLCSDPIRTSTLQDEFMRGALNPIKCVHKQYFNIHTEVYFHDHNTNKNRRIACFISLYDDSLVEKQDSDFGFWNTMLSMEKVVPFC